MKAIEKQLN